MKSVGGEIVVGQLLAIVIGRYIIDVHLIASFDVIEEEMIIGHIENELFHAGGQIMQSPLIFVIAIGIAASDQRMEYDERLVEIPNKDPFG